MQSSLSDPCVGVEEDGYAEVSRAAVNLLISSSVSPPLSSTHSCGIVCITVLELLMWVVLLVTVCTPMG